MQQSEEAPGGSGDPNQAFVLPEKLRGRKAHDMFDLFRPPIPTSADDEFWTNRPYQPNGREANLIALGIGVLGLLILGITPWFPVFLVCTSALGLAAILAGTILNLTHYENPWWRIPALLAIVCGVVELANVAAWFNTTSP